MCEKKAEAEKKNPGGVAFALLYQDFENSILKTMVAWAQKHGLLGSRYVCGIWYLVII